MRVLDLSKRFADKVQNTLLFDRSPKWLTSPEYAKKFNAKWHKVYEQMPNKRPPVVYYGALMADLQRRLDPEFPEAGVLELTNALLYGEAGWIFSEEGYLLPDHSWYGQHVNEMKTVPRFLPRGRRLEGVCLSLASDFAVGSYGHFMLDCISRLELFNKAGFKLSDVDHIFCPKPPSKTAQRLFDQLGIPVSKCIWANGNKDVVHTETLLAPSFPGTRRNYQKWLPAFIKRELLPSPPPPSRRLYISRAGCRRNVVNEEAITRILIQRGFEIYDPAQHTSQPYDFAESTIIVGPHGGGLTDLVFCQPGTKVIELIPTDHVYPYYYTLSDAATLEYGCLVCQSTYDRGQDTWGPSSANFYVNEDELDSALARITA
ncbi:MAG: glycosyltransferase family 61 protein [Kovacikia sp.]